MAKFHAATNSTLFKFKQEITGQTTDNGTKDVEMMVTLKYLSDFLRTLKMAYINIEINLILTWSEKCVLSDDTKATKIAVSDTKIYVPVVILSTQDNAKQLQQLKLEFRRTINWKKYQPKVSAEVPNPYFDFLIDPIFQGVIGLFVLSFEYNDDRTVHTKFIFQL